MTIKFIRRGNKKILIRKNCIYSYESRIKAPEFRPRYLLLTLPESKQTFYIKSTIKCTVHIFKKMKYDRIQFMPINAFIIPIVCNAEIEQSYYLIFFISLLFTCKKVNKCIHSAIRFFRDTRHYYWPKVCQLILKTLRVGYCWVVWGTMEIHRTGTCLECTVRSVYKGHAKEPVKVTLWSGGFYIQVQITWLKSNGDKNFTGF